LFQSLKSIPRHISSKLALPLARVDCKAPMTAEHSQKASKLAQTTIGDFGRAWAGDKPACWPAMEEAEIVGLSMLAYEPRNECT